MQTSLIKESDELVTKLEKLIQHSFELWKGVENIHGSNYQHNMEMLNQNEEAIKTIQDRLGEIKRIEEEEKMIA